MDNIDPKRAKGDLLIIDDDLSALQILEDLLSREGYEVRGAPNGQTGLMFAREDPPDLILLDIRLPDIDGFQVCRRLKEDQKTSNIPVIFLSGLEDVEDKVKGFEAGGVDYITKMLKGEEVLARVETHLTLKRLQKQIEAQNAQLQQEITKSKKSEEKIRHAAEEWRTTFDSIKEPISIHDKDFRIVKVNKAFAAAFGMEIKEILGKKCYEIVHATGEPWPICPHRQTLESGKQVTAEFFEPRLGRFLEVSASPIFNDQDEVIGSVHIAKDITERKQTEEALKISETRYRRLFETAHDGILILDADTGRITDVNPFLVEMLGYSHEEFLGKKLWEIGAFKDIEMSKAAFSELQTKGYVRYEGLPLQTKDGRLIEMEFVSNVYKVNHHKVIQCNIRDITDRKRAEKALQKVHEELEKRVKERTADLVRANQQLGGSEKELEGRLRFETLLADLSARFINLPTGEIDGKIKDAQRRLCEILDIDRSVLWQVPETEPGAMLLAHIHQPPGSRPPPGRADARDLFPWSAQKALSGEIVAVSKISDLPPEAARDREIYQLYGTKSTLVVPLLAGGGTVLGVLTFSVMREERDWPEATVKGLQLIAQVFGNALDRKRADQALRESAERLSLATDAAEAGLWIVELDTSQVWATARTRELFHFAPDEELNYESFVKVICPEDRAQVEREVQQALQSGEPLSSEFRVLLPDGSIRWIGTRGRRYSKSTAKPERLMGVSVNITERKQMEAQLRERLLEIEQLKQRFERENIYLQEEIRLLVEHTEIVGKSVAMKRILAQAEQVAQTDSTVLILGETGTGKELLARAIHSMSTRKDRPLVTVNCASLPPTLIESELFGRERGAYTGALTRMVGRFELADGSTLFLDEIGELPLELQSKLLRVLEEGKYERLGSNKTLRVNVRIIAATNRDIAREVKEGKFRNDLYYRLNVFPIVIPPLRERSEDIPLMVWAFVREFQKRMGKEIESIPRKSIDALQSYPWPGNVRELRNVIERAMIVSSGKTLTVQVPGLASSDTQAAPNLEETERRQIVSVLERTGWRVAGKGGGAEVLGLKRTTLQSKMKKLGIKRPAT
jgi:formate hydrogenlyase transcriptional activator